MSKTIHIFSKNIEVGFGFKIYALSWYTKRNWKNAQWLEIGNGPLEVLQSSLDRKISMMRKGRKNSSKNMFGRYLFENLENEAHCTKYT